MEAKQPRHEGDKEKIKMNIKQFIEATRQYLFELAMPQPALVPIPIRKDR